jgi:hypothetical protein
MRVCIGMQYATLLYPCSVPNVSIVPIRARERAKQWVSLFTTVSDDREVSEGVIE